MGPRKTDRRSLSSAFLRGPWRGIVYPCGKRMRIRGQWACPIPRRPRLAVRDIIPAKAVRS